MIDEQKQKIIALRRDGAGYGQIVAAVGISIYTVKSFCRRHSLAAKKATAVGIGLIKNSVPIFVCRQISALFEAME